MKEGKLELKERGRRKWCRKNCRPLPCRGHWEAGRKALATGDPDSVEASVSSPVPTGVCTMEVPAHITGLAHRRPSSLRLVGLVEFDVAEGASLFHRGPGRPQSCSSMAREEGPPLVAPPGEHPSGFPWGLLTQKLPGEPCLQEKPGL